MQVRRGVGVGGGVGLRVRVGVTDRTFNYFTSFRNHDPQRHAQTVAILIHFYRNVCALVGV